MITTTLNRIRAHGPCREGWEKLLKAWVKDCATARDMALGSMLGMEQGLSLASAAPAALGEIKDEAAEQ